MRLMKVFKSASAAALIFGTVHATPTSSAASGDQANDAFKRKEPKEVKSADDAGAAKMTGNMRTGPGTAPIQSPPAVGVPATFVLLDVQEDAVEVSPGMHEDVAALPRLMISSAITMASSGIDTDFATPVGTFYEVSTELVAVDRHEAQDDDEAEGLRWTRFEQRTPTPPDYFSARFSTTCLYVAHIISADHIRTLLYGRRYGRRHRRRRRYCRINPNSRRNRRLRRLARVNADLDRMLWGAWTQMVIWIASPFFGGELEESVTSRASLSPLVPNPAAAPVVVIPVPAVPVAHWPPVADSRVNLPPACPLAVLTPLETPAAPWPPLSPFAPAAALGAAIPLEELPAAPLLLPPALPVAPLERVLDAAMADAALAIVPFVAPAAPRPALGRLPPAAALGAAIPLEELPVALLPIAPLNWEPNAAQAIVPFEAPAAPRPALEGIPPEAAVGAAIPLEELPVAPLPIAPLPIAPLNWEPKAALAIVPLVAPAAPRPALDGFPPAAALRAAIPLEERPVAPLPIAPLSIAPLNWEPNAALAIVPFVAPAAPRPALDGFPPAAALRAAIPLEERPVAPLPIASLPIVPLPIAPRNWEAPDAAMILVPLIAAVDRLDIVNWSSVAKTFAVMDLDESDGMVVPERGWGDAIKADVERFLSVEACPSEREGVRWILTEAVELYPFTGYEQGSEHAALAIYRGMTGDKEAALRVFVQWASPAAWFQRSTVDGQPVQLEKGMRHSWKVLRKQSPAAHTWLGDETMDALYSEIFLSAVCSVCTCQGLPSDVVHCLIQKTLEAGNNGPAVSLWVMHSLLAIAESECKTRMDATPDMCIRTRLISAGETITTFDDLQQHAPMALNVFVNGYAAAVFGKVRLF